MRRSKIGYVWNVIQEKYKSKIKLAKVKFFAISSLQFLRCSLTSLALI